MPNPSMPAERIDQYLQLLGDCVMLARAAVLSRDYRRADALLDAIHNLPGLLAGKHVNWTEDYFVDVFLAGLIAEYPEYERLRRLLE